jgi:hypothetical protein
MGYKKRQIRKAMSTTTWGIKKGKNKNEGPEINQPDRAIKIVYARDMDSLLYKYDSLGGKKTQLPHDLAVAIAASPLSSTSTSIDKGLQTPTNVGNYNSTATARSRHHDTLPYHNRRIHSLLHLAGLLHLKTVHSPYESGRVASFSMSGATSPMSSADQSPPRFGAIVHAINAVMIYISVTS